MFVEVIASRLLDFSLGRSIKVAGRVRQLRVEPGAWLTHALNPARSEERLLPPISHLIGNDWLFVVDRESWIRRPRGFVLAAHVRAENLRNHAADVPALEIQSGALRRRGELSEQCSQESVNFWPLPARADPLEAVRGWVLAPLAYRFEGGRPGYTITSDDVPGNWRGISRLSEHEPRKHRNEDAPEIADELAVWHYLGGTLLDETKMTEAMFERRRTHYIEGLGGTEDLARSRLIGGHERKYRNWAQQVVPYLRDRIGRGYALQFEGEMDSTSLVARIERQRNVLRSFMEEFRQLATSPDRAA